MDQAKKKTWRFLRDIHANDLEDKINELAADGYSVFRADRHESIGSIVLYDVLVFDPVEIGARSAAAMNAAITKAAGLAPP